MLITLMCVFLISEKKKNFLDHISLGDSLLKHSKKCPFLKKIVTGNEKWILYNNVG